ncbi:MAG: MFS transporter [Rhodospirillaceae bacterium]|nr:MFS transporter [Rhodospirillaceae bacterium]
MTTDSQNSVPQGLLFVFGRVFVPFALGYFLSYMYRTVNAVLGPILGTELGIDAVAIGLLTGAYFFAFAAVQIPLGMALDKFGPRRTQTVLLAVAAAGAFLFSQGDSTLELAMARALIGVGVSGCLLASFKIFALWMPKQKLPLVNGLLLACGGAGVMASSSPVQAAVELMGWRHLFHIIALATLVVAVIIFVIVPERRATGEPNNLADQIRGLTEIFRSRIFWSVAPLVMTAQAAWMSTQALWFGPWLRDMAGLDADAAATTLFIGGIGMVLGYASLGWLTERLSRIGISVGLVAGIATAIFIGVQLLLAFNAALPAWVLTAAFAYTGGAPTIFYASLTQKFPVAMAGRVNTSLALFTFSLAGLLQLAMGAMLDFFPATAGGYTETGYLIAFGGWATFQIICFGWFLLARRQT